MFAKFCEISLFLAGGLPCLAYEARIGSTRGTATTETATVVTAPFVAGTVGMTSGLRFCVPLPSTMLMGEAVATVFRFAAGRRARWGRGSKLSFDLGDNGGEQGGLSITVQVACI